MSLIILFKTVFNFICMLYVWAFILVHFCSIWLLFLYYLTLGSIHSTPTSFMKISSKWKKTILLLLENYLLLRNCTLPKFLLFFSAKYLPLSALSDFLVTVTAKEVSCCKLKYANLPMRQYIRIQSLFFRYFVP